MKVVIQHKKSFQYVHSDADWTDDPFQALDFGGIQRAVDFCQKRNLRDVYIVSGEFNAAAKRFNAASKTIWDAAQFQSRVTA